MLCNVMLSPSSLPLLAGFPFPGGPPFSSLLPPTAYRLPPTAYNLLPTTYHLPPTTYRLPPTASGYHHLPPSITYRRRLLPPTAYRLSSPSQAITT
jgi:hypothetical protein